MIKEQVFDIVKWLSENVYKTVFPKRQNMKETTETLESFKSSYDLNSITDPNSLLFIDIETTGFTARTSYLYLIGCAYLSDNKWCTKQWLAEKYEEEADIINCFFEFATEGGYDTLVHFNGNQFDLPYLTQKITSLGLELSIDSFKGIDLYRRISPLKHLLGLTSLKQRSIERFLGIERTDVFSGGDLIGIYHDYVKNPSEFACNTLLLHNEDDLKGMIRILPMLAYPDLTSGKFRVTKVHADTYKDYNGQSQSEIIMSLKLESSLPRQISSFAHGCYIKADKDEAVIKVPLYNEEMKYFYASYQDYYYLPEEDTALHKSVATFVDKDHRTQATAATCYTRKQSSYLPQWDTVFEPLFRREYRSTDLFFELTDDMKRDRNAFNKYASHIISMLASTY